MKIQISFLIFFILLGCKKEEADNTVKFEAKKAVAKTVETKQKQLHNNAKITTDKITGIWTDGSTENATFEIKSKSIYYVEYFENYDYQLNNDTIEIKFPDYIYRAAIVLKNDTLITTSKEYGKTKFWRFKE